jgi:hypothetical protein
VDVSSIVITSEGLTNSSVSLINSEDHVVAKSLIGESAVPLLYPDPAELLYTAPDALTASSKIWLAKRFMDNELLTKNIAYLKDCGTNCDEGYVTIVTGKFSWNSATEKCDNMNRKLCPRSAICPSGERGEPLGGNRKKELWAPLGDEGSRLLSEYGRGVGYPRNDGCEADHGSGKCEKYDLLYYPKCWAGYSAVGCCICRLLGSSNQTSEYGRGVGYPWQFGDSLNDNGMIQRCEAEHGSGKCEKYGLLYYPKCRAGYSAVGCCICRLLGGSFNQWINIGIEGDRTNVLCYDNTGYGNPGEIVDIGAEGSYLQWVGGGGLLPSDVHDTEVYCCTDTPAGYLTNIAELQTRQADFFDTGLSMDSIDKSISLVFGDKTTIGQVCAYSKGLTSTNKTVIDIPGFCCLDAPYKARTEEWGEKVRV